MDYPLRKDGYPRAWATITARIMVRDKHCCTKCGLRNHLVGYRMADGSFALADHLPCELVPVLRSIWPSLVRKPELGILKIWHLRLWVALLKRFAPGPKWFWVKLGVAHLDRGLTDHDDSNLAALCAQCHLRHDLPVSVPRAVASRKYGSKRAKSMHPLFPQ